LFEVILLVGVCFLVNHVTADAKTNWAEGWVLVLFYVMSVIVNPLFACGRVRAKNKLGDLGVVLSWSRQKSDYELV
ncbi:hypothetical protein F5888DRAFT_1614618, partial [Russula emetica]